MPWTPNDKPRIIKNQAFSRTSRNSVNYTDRDSLVQGQMNDLTDEALITFIQADLDSLDALDLAIAEQSNANATIIKAGSVEWSEGSRTEAIEERSLELRQRIAQTLSQMIGPVDLVDADSGGGVIGGLMLF